MDNQINANKIRIAADLRGNEPPRLYGTRDGVKLKSGDCAVFEFLLLNGGALADISGIASVSLEILDIGEPNSPSPRAVKVLASKSKTSSGLNSLSSASDFANGQCSVSFALSSSETLFGDGFRWLSLAAYSSEGEKTTFAQGWIEVFEQYSSDSPDPAVPESSIVRRDYAEASYMKKSENLGDVASASSARTNLGVYSKSETDALFSARDFALSAKEGFGKFYAGNWSIAQVNNNGGMSIKPPCSLVFTTTDMHGMFFQMLNCQIGGITNIASPYFAVQDAAWIDSASVSVPKADIYFAAFVFDAQGGMKIAVNNSSSYTENFLSAENGFSIYPDMDATGNCSRAAIFNFDVLEANALYTFAEYREGKTIPAILRTSAVYTPDPDLGASAGAWNISSEPSSTQTHGCWSAGTYVAWLKNRASDLPEGETCAIDIATSEESNYSDGSTKFLHCPSANFYKLRGKTAYVHIKFKYRCNVSNPSSDYTSLVIFAGDSVEIWSRSAYAIRDNAWHTVDEVRLVNFTGYIEQNEANSALGVYVGNVGGDYTDYPYSIAGLSVKVLAVAAEYDDALSGSQIRDISGNGNHIEVYASDSMEGSYFTAEKRRNPASASYAVSVNLAAAAGAALGGSSAVKTALLGRLCTLRLFSDKAHSFKIGTLNSAAKYGTLTFSAANTWQTLQFAPSGDTPIVISRGSSGTGTANLKAIINYEEL